MLEVGSKAPDFELPDQNGKTHRLSDYTGKKVILYFYPKVYILWIQLQIMSYFVDKPCYNNAIESDDFSKRNEGTTWRKNGLHYY